MDETFFDLKKINFGVLIIVILMLMMVILPLPPFLLDILFTFNIGLSLIVLLVSIYIAKPLDFSIFPTVLLITTLLRLTLNIASTRVILLHGHNGAFAAGNVIRAFGEVVIGGDFIVGIIVFSILMIINFVVVTKGAGRISEVSARFILDSLPGKQMSIDADLNAGIIQQEEAKKRRMSLIHETDFYGSMDGASKFIRGDAVAGLLILLINLIGGIIIAIFRHGLSLQEASQTFSLLTIGDGLVAQIPSLLMSIASAIMVTRVTTEQDLKAQLVAQIFHHPAVMVVAASILFLLALVPSMPHFPFMLLAFLIFLSAYWVEKNEKEKENGFKPAVSQMTELEQAAASSAMVSSNSDLSWNDVIAHDDMILEIGFGLISIVGANKDGQLVNRVKGVRKKLSKELGFLLPAIRVRDNLQLGPNHYCIYLKGVLISEGDIYPDQWMAINPGQLTQPLQGMPCKDPSFGMDAFWIDVGLKEYATSLGYTVVDASTVIATHLNQIIKRYAADLLGYDETQKIISGLADNYPKLVETLNSPALGVPLNIVVGVLQRLLRADIPLIDMRTIIEKMIEAWSKAKDIEVVTGEVRIALKHLIINQLCQLSQSVPVAVVDQELAQLLHKSMQGENQIGERGMALEPSLSEKIYARLLEYIRRCELEAIPAILLSSSDLRSWLEKLFKSNLPNLHFISHNEIPENRKVSIIAKIG